MKPEESVKPSTRKKRFRQLRRAMSLSHRHKPTPPDTAPPTPTVQYQTPSSGGVKSLESLAHWQLPDPTSAPTPLDGDLIVWPSGLSPQRLSPRVSYRAPLGQLSPPSSIPSESDILPPDSLIGLGISRPSISLFPQPSSLAAQPPRTKYPPALYDTLNLSDPEVLEKNRNGKVVAGTVEGLVAYITSPDCLDYEVLSDFFVMYRKFLDPSELLSLLCARYEWGLLRGKVVKAPDNEGTFLIFEAYCRYGASKNVCSAKALAFKLLCRRFCTIAQFTFPIRQIHQFVCEGCKSQSECSRYKDHHRAEKMLEKGMYSILGSGTYKRRWCPGFRNQSRWSET
jgi:hypothetical protein